MEALRWSFPRALLIAALLVHGIAFAGRIDNLKKQAEAGDASAQYQLGMAYDLGSGVKKDPVLAAQWCLKAAEQGVAAAQNCIGSMYQFGDGVVQNDAAAVGWFEKAVAQDYGEAYTNLGYMYDLGKGVTQDRAKGMELYRAGAERGSLNAMLDLGISCRQQGNFVESYMWLDLARFYTQGTRDMRLKWRVRGALDELRKEMTGEQIQEAEHRGREWDKAHPHAKTAFTRPAE